MKLCERRLPANQEVILLFGLSVWFAAFAPAAAQQAPSERKPNFDANKHQTVYSGPGRDEPDPEGLKEVLLGYFGPPDPSHPECGDMWLAVTLAVEQENAGGGYRGLPFRLVPAWSDKPWASGAALLAKIIYTDGVWAIIGSIDGPTTHLAEQVVAKARIPLVSPGSTDKTVNYANVPWMFTCLPSDARQAPVLLEAMNASGDKGSLTLLSANDHDSQHAMREYRSLLYQRGLVPARHVEYQAGSLAVDGAAGQAAAAKPGAVLLVSGPLDSARMVVSLRRQGFRGTIFAHHGMSRRAALEAAGAAAEGIVLPLLWQPSPEHDRFVAEFERRHNRTPDFAAAQAFDSVRLIAAAIRRAGLNRARIRDALEALAPWHGAAGEIRWDGLNQNTRTVGLAIIRSGMVVPLRGTKDE